MGIITVCEAPASPPLAGVSPPVFLCLSVRYMSKANAFTSGGTAAVQFFVAAQSGFVRVSGQEVYVQANVHAVPSTSPLYLAAPQLFVPMVVTTWP